MQAVIHSASCMVQCPMEAITQDENGFYQPTAMCFNCGQCARVCPADARYLVPKEKWETFERADDLFSDNLQAARAHMAFGGITDFSGDVDAARENNKCVELNGAAIAAFKAATGAE